MYLHPWAEVTVIHFAPSATVRATTNNASAGESATPKTKRSPDLLVASIVYATAFQQLSANFGWLYSISLTASPIRARTSSYSAAASRSTSTVISEFPRIMIWSATIGM